MNFDRPIKLYSVTSTQNNLGEHVPSMELIVETMAEKVFKRGGESFTAGQRVAKTVESFRIRYRSLTNVNVLEYDGKNYDILNIEEEGRKHTLVLECEKRDSQ